MRYGRRVAGTGLVLSGLLAGILLVTPATAHFTREPRHLAVHAWNKVIKHAVTAGRIAPQAVGTAKLVDGAVTNPKLGMGSVGPGKIATGAVTSAKLANGAVGKTKIAGGAVTASKLAPVTQVMSETGLLANGSSGTATANCPAGTLVIGGGFDNVTDAGVSTTGVRMARSLRVGTDGAPPA